MKFSLVTFSNSSLNFIKVIYKDLSKLLVNNIFDYIVIFKNISIREISVPCLLLKMNYQKYIDFAVVLYRTINDVKFTRLFQCQIAGQINIKLQTFEAKKNSVVRMNFYTIYILENVRSTGAEIVKSNTP